MSNKETLRIRNFAGIKDAEIEVSRINVFIGPQATGKSVTAKLLFYFKEILRKLSNSVEDGLDKRSIKNLHIQLFQRYFPPSVWSQSFFCISYSFGNLAITVSKKNNDSQNIDIAYSQYYDDYLKQVEGHEKLTVPPVTNIKEASQRDKNQNIILNALKQNTGASVANKCYFIPAGRSFFSTFDSAHYTLITNDIDLDMFMAEFANMYRYITRYYNVRLENTPSEIRKKISSLLCGNYARIDNKDYIQTDDGRTIPLAFASSGQQESLPLTLSMLNFAADDQLFSAHSLFIEEPEAHLFPSSQKTFIHLFSLVANYTTQEHANQYFITTHSPYILTSLNNLMYGYIIASSKAVEKERICGALDGAALIDPKTVRAYAFFNGGLESIIDPDTSLVDASFLDNVSSELADEFNVLMDIEYQEQAA